jgi:hypothetical protein
MADHAAPPFPTPGIALVGREREQATLRDTLEAALAKRGSLALIGGEAGLGTTALAEWLLAEAVDRGALVMMVARCATRAASVRTMRRIRGRAMPE